MDTISLYVENEEGIGGSEPPTRISPHELRSLYKLTLNINDVILAVLKNDFELIFLRHFQDTLN